MEGNDIGTTVGYKHIVIMEPTIVAPPENKRTVYLGGGRMFGKQARRARLFTEWIEEWTLNRLMCQWIYQQAARGIGTEVWSFLDEATFELLADRITQVINGEIVGWERWVRPLDAMTRLRSDTMITAIYDADPHRIATMWGFRGHAVLGGNAP